MDLLQQCNQIPSVAPPEVVLQEIEDVSTQTVPSDANDTLSDKISSATPDVTLQKAEDTSVGTTQQVVESAVSNTTLDVPSDTVLQEVEAALAETIP